MILTHYYDPDYSEHAFRIGSISIEDNVFVGAGAHILCDSRIGKGAVVAAGAVVTKEVDDGAVVAGIPARVVGARGKKSVSGLPNLASMLRERS